MLTLLLAYKKYDIPTPHYYKVLVLTEQWQDVKSQCNPMLKEELLQDLVCSMLYVKQKHHKRYFATDHIAFINVVAFFEYSVHCRV